MNHVKRITEIRRITPSGEHFYFGYYDRQPFSADGRYHLAVHPSFMDRPNTGGDKAEIGLIDLENDNTWIPLDDETAWNWQMGANQQWLGTAPNRKVIYNARAGNRVFARTRDIVSGETRDLPMPVYDVSNDGAWGIALNFARIHNNRAGYGYPDLVNPVSDTGASDEDGLWRMDLVTGETRLTVSLADVAGVEPEPDMEGAQHWFNHVMISPMGSRLMFLHRWKTGQGRHRTRLFTCTPGGSDLFLLNRGPMVSHSDWRDEEHFISFCNYITPEWAYYVHTDKTQLAEVIGAEVFDPGRDGHCHYYPRGDKRWFVTDTYPNASESKSDSWEHDLILYDTRTDTRVDVGRFASLPHYEGEIRCDFHARWDSSGRRLSFDSIHEGHRGIYVMDVGAIVD